jgi:hypothetical protein
MRGPEIIARSLSGYRSVGKSRSKWQYHSRSDHHSKVCCWAIAFDLLRTSSLLRRHVADGKVTIGVNHTMADFRSSRRKDLDLVVARPTATSATPGESLRALGERNGIVLTDEDRHEFGSLPDVAPRPVGVVLMALEAKAAATEHKKAESRMYDELNSSQATVHGAADQAVAIGLALVNIASEFVSPGRQKHRGPRHLNRHKQPQAAASLIAKLRELPRRSRPGDDGFDALGILVVDLRNDGSPVRIEEGPPAPAATDVDNYDSMIVRAATAYDYRFAAL